MIFGNIFNHLEVLKQLNEILCNLMNTLTLMNNNLMFSRHFDDCFSNLVPSYQHKSYWSAYPQ